METTVSERLLLFIKYKGISVRKFEASIGASTGFVKKISKGIGNEKLKRILAEYPELNRDWLLYGEGEMLKSAAPAISHSAVVTAANSLAINGDHNMVPDPNAISGSELYKTQLYLTQQLLAEKDKQLAEKERTIELLQKLLESK